MKLPLWFDRQSASKLVALAWLGGITATAGFYTECYLDLHIDAASSIALLIPIGVALYFAAKRGLEHGVSAERWTRTQLDPLLPRLHAMRVTAGCLMIVLCLASIISRHMFHRHPIQTFPWFVLFLFAQSQIALRAILQPPAPPRPEKGLWKETFQPIHSEHWGTR